MPSRPSVCLPVNFFSNRIGSLSFYPIHVYGLNVHNNIAQLHRELEFWFFFLKYLNGFLIIENVRIGIYGGSGPFSQKVFDVRPWNLMYSHIVGILSCVYENGPCEPYSLALFDSDLGQNSSKCRFSTIFWKKFPLDAHETWFIGSLQLFLEVCKRTQRPKFSGHFGPPK